MPSFKAKIEVEVEISYEIEPGQVGYCDSLGCPEEPSWDAYPDEIEVKYPVEPSPELMETLVILCEEDMEGED